MTEQNKQSFRVLMTSRRQANAAIPVIRAWAERHFGQDIKIIVQDCEEIEKLKAQIADLEWNLKKLQRKHSLCRDRGGR